MYGMNYDTQQGTCVNWEQNTMHRHEIQHNDIQHNNTEYNHNRIMVLDAECQLC
jgi:hypothetical protein